MTKSSLPGAARTTLLLCSVVLTAMGCTPPSSGEQTLEVVGSTAEAILSTTVWSHDTTSGKASSVAWGDYDNDGDLDLVIGNDHGGSPCRLFQNTGGGFTEVWQSATNESQALAWGDFDNDGDLDLAIANDGAATMVYENQGSGASAALAASPAWVSSTNYDSEGLAWGDYDGDGDLDLAIANDGDPDELFRNDGFTTSASGNLLNMTAVIGWSVTIQDDSKALAWGDWDNDGDLDLAIANDNSGQPSRVYRNDSGTLVDAWQSNSKKTKDVAWGDWDGDGYLDLAFANDGQVNQVYENLGPGSGSRLPSQPNWTSTPAKKSMSVAWGDVDGDGDLDLAFANEGQQNRIYENLSPASGTSAPLAQTSTHFSARTKKSMALAWGDWDGDGDLDLIVANKEQTEYLYENTGNSPSLDWESSSAWSSAGLALGDVDGDGDLDLAVANSDSAEPDLVFLNNGGTFSSNADWTGGNTASQAVAWGDVDGDGDLDLAVAVANGPNLLYENLGGTATTVIPLDTQPSLWQSLDTNDSRSLAWGDYDGDGDLDLAVGNYGAANVIYENQGGVLGRQAQWTSNDADNTTSLAWGHLGSDLYLDLAAANEGGANRIYSNSAGTLSETAQWDSADTEDTRGVAWGDFDDDGDADLAFANNSNPDRVYRNNAGVLALAWTSSGSEAGQALSWADLDGDGWLDLVVANTGAGAQWYRNALGVLPADPDFISPVTEDSTGLVAADIDADGDIDLVQTNDGGKVQLERSFRIGSERVAQNPSYAYIPSPDASPVAGALSSEIHEGATLGISFVLYDLESDPIDLLVQYSTSGGAWANATILDTGTATTASTRNRASSPSGTTHTMDWDLAADGVFSDTASLRAVITRQKARNSSVSLRHGLLGSNSTTFRAWACFPRDVDGDGIDTCGPDGPSGTGDVDCNDADPTIFPGATEVCDGIDNDCINGIDDGLDLDGDGFTTCGADGDPATSADNDCDDDPATGGNIFPGATELCDGIDNDCDPATAAAGGENDGDGDGELSCVDCDDSDSDNYFGNTEVCDGNDNDCSGSADFDTAGELDDDGDNFFTCDNDCDDDPATGSNIFPGATEVCDGIDNDCTNGVDDGFDQDGDGVTTCGADGDPATTADNDCDDAPATGSNIFPGATEVCDGIDNNCTNDIDDGFDLDGDGVTTCGADGDPATAADNDCDDDPATGGNNFPGNPEACDGLDNDCDGAPDNDVVNQDWYLDADGDGFGDIGGTATSDCGSPGTDYVTDNTDCNDDDIDISPSEAEDCSDGIDNDCDGDIDDVDDECLAGDDDDSAGDDDDSAGDDDDSAGDDDDSAGDDDDSEGDDDDSEGDDDDSAACVDADQDGFCAEDGDCDDSDPSINPIAPESCDDGVDSNCNEVETDELDEPHCWAAGCDCSQNPGTAYRPGHVLAVWLGLFLMASNRRRRTRQARGRGGVVAGAALCLLLPLLSGITVAAAQTGESESRTVSTDELRKQIESSQCEAARRRIQEQLEKWPNSPDLWRLLGDAERCLGETRSAVLAYRRFEDLGSADPTLTLLLQSLRANLAVLDVELTVVTPEDESAAHTRPNVFLKHLDELLVPTWTSPFVAHFEDLPPSVGLQLGSHGLGFVSSEQDVLALDPGTVTKVELTPQWVGVGELLLASAAAEGLVVTAALPWGETQLSAQTPVPVSAGIVVVECKTELGSTQIEIDVHSDERRLFSPAISLPASLKVTGLPAGASLRLYVEGPGAMAVTQEFTTSPDVGSIDPSTGVRMGPPQDFKSLPGGTGGLFVSHRILGTGVQEVVLAAGERNAVTFKWRELAGVKAVSKAHQDWLSRDALRLKTAKRPLVAGIVAASTGIAAAIFGGAAAGANKAASDAKDSAELAQASQNLDRVHQLGTDYLSAQRNQRGFGAGSAILSSMSIGSLGLTVSFGIANARKKANARPWEPWSVVTGP